MSKSSVLELAKKFVAAIEKEEQKPEIGKTIEVAGINWLVLDKLEKGYFAISEDFYGRDREFDDNCNDWKSSDLRNELNTDLRKKIESELGTDSLVVFDPPHLRYAGKTGWLAKKYGRLDEHWPEMLHDGFKECMRVLKEDGVLIFKWAETDIPAQKVWKAIGQKPLFGHHSGKRSGTFFGCYMKGQK